MANFKIQDNFLTEQEYEELTTLHIEYSKLHWIGLYALKDLRKNKPLNQLHKLVKRIEPEEDVLGATAWYNIRPPRPKPHNDIDSYCTFKGKKYYPDILPKRTYLYYVKVPDEGGNLRLETGEEIELKVNRLVSFPIDMVHQVMPYKGNRVSIGIIFWPQLPSFYGRVTNTEIQVFDRVWEIEDENIHTK